MTRSIKVTLDTVHFTRRISERMTEIGKSIDYHKLYSRPEIVLFTIICSGKNSEREIMEAAKEASAGISFFPFLINGFLRRTSDKDLGLSLKIEASPEIEKFSRNFQKALTIKEKGFWKSLDDKKGLCIPLMPYPGLLDSEIILRHSQQREKSLVTRLLSFKRKKPKYKIRKFVLPAESFRINLSDEKGFLKTYDLVLKRWINGSDIQRSKESFEQFRIIRGYESIEKKYLDNDECFIISDLHLGHPAIIEGAARPFYPGDFRKMDETLIKNWNNQVKNSDKVFYLGDLTYNLNFEICNAYLSQLNGEIVFIRGNHDVCMAGCPERLEINHSGRDYLLIHDPKFRPDDYSGWMIHGHVHNSRAADYPFIDFKNRTINASCEFTGYHPVRFRDISKAFDMYESGEINDRKCFSYQDLRDLIKTRSD